MEEKKIRLAHTVLIDALFGNAGFKTEWLKTENGISFNFISKEYENAPSPWGDWYSVKASTIQDLQKVLEEIENSEGKIGNHMVKYPPDDQAWFFRDDYRKYFADLYEKITKVKLGLDCLMNVMMY